MQTFARSDLDALRRYADATAQPVDLTDNTNQWGSPPAASEILREGGAVARYPDMYGAAMKDAVARVVGCSVQSVVTGNGSDDVLDCAIRAFGSPGDRLAYPDPTFVMIPVFSRLNSVVPVPVPVDSDGAMDVDALLATKAPIIYLCSPNNPTATATPENAIRRVLDNATGLVILDEAYIDFTTTTGFAREAASRSNVLVCRTLSKAYGMAGLRIGYGVAHPDVIESIEKSRGPFKLNLLAERAAVTALSHDRDWVMARAADAIEHRERFAAELRQLGLPPLSSAANFVFVPTPRAATLTLALETAGIGVRLFVNTTRFGDAIRITIAPWPIMERVLAVLRAAA